MLLTVREIHHRPACDSKCLASVVMTCYDVCCVSGGVFFIFGELVGRSHMTQESGCGPEPAS